ncbi:MAG: tyrosine-type recombinase/integrase [Planctomycetes bacterium]|nr:tyrosine-type recombinase/integrase [Planctomycetota bacterium]
MDDNSFSRLDFDGAIDAFVDDRKARNYAPDTIKINKDHLGRFIKFLKRVGIPDIHSVEYQHIIDFYKTLEEHRTKAGKPYAQNTKDKYLMDVRSFFNYLKKKQLILLNPVDALPPIRSRSSIPLNALTLDEAHAILAQPKLHVLTEFRDLCIMHILLSTGIRPKSLCSLTIYSLDFQDGFLRVNQAKFNQDYVVPLGTVATEVCREYLQRVRIELTKKNPAEKALFLTKTGKPLHQRSLYGIVIKYVKRAKISRAICPYSFRRFVGVEMIRSGKCSILHIQQMLNHQSLRHVHLYTKMMPIDLKKAHEKLHRESKEPKKDLDFKGFEGNKPIFFKKKKGDK